MTRPVVAWALVALGAVVRIGPARADWEYTHWGMTADQVIAASHGAASMMPRDLQFRDDDAKIEITVQATAGDLPVSGIGFEFDSPGGGLRCVIYNATGKDAEALRLALVAKYGKPASDSAEDPMRDIKWTTPDSIEMVILASPARAVVNHCAPERG